MPPKTNQSGNIKNMQTTCRPALFVRKVGWTDGSVHRLGLGRRTSEHDVHVGRLLDKAVVWHSDDDCAHLCRSRTLCTELFQWSVLHLTCTQSLHPTNHTDASAALSIAFRSGAGGRTRHDAVILGFKKLSPERNFECKRSELARIFLTCSPSSLALRNWVDSL